MAAVIETPEQLGFRVELAGLAHRAAAWILDTSIRGVLLAISAAGLGFFGSLSDAVFGAAGAGYGQGLFLVLLFAVTWLYFVFFEMVMRGSSPGKRAFGLRVLSQDGLPITLRQSVLRNLGRAADVLVAPGAIVPVGGLVIALDPRSRRLGDLLAGTIVVVERRVPDPPARSPSLAELEALPVRPPLDRDDLEALEAFVRRGALTDERRREIADLIAPTYARRLGRSVPDDSAAFLVALWARARGIVKDARR